LRINSSGLLSFIENGTVVRAYDINNAEVNVNRGELTGSSVEPMESWVEAASFVDDDDLAFSETGLLCLHGTTA